MADIPKTIIQVAQEIRKGGPPTRVRLREVLGWFGASHRNAKLLAQIERALSTVGLATTPSVWDAGIDDEVALVSLEPAQSSVNVTSFSTIRSKAILSIDSESGFPVYRVRDFLAALDMAYNHVYVALLLLSDPKLRSRELVRLNAQPERRFARLVPASDRLMLDSVELRSPGFWSVFGDKSILEQIRLYLNDRHERRKDHEYRELAERKSLELDNRLKQAELSLKLGSFLQQQIDLARKTGASEDDIRLIVERFISLPLSALDQYEDQPLIGSARIIDEKTMDKNVPG